MKSAKERRALAAEHKKQIQPLIKILKTIVAKYDPESFLAMEVPAKQYDSVCQLIAERLWAERGWAKSKDELANIIALAFHSEFQPWSQPVKMFGLYYEMAKELKPLIPEIKRK